MSTTGPEFEPPQPGYPPPGQPPPGYQPPQQPGYQPPSYQPPGQPPPGYPPPGQPPPQQPGYGAPGYPPPGQPPPGYQPPQQPSYQPPGQPIYQPTGYPGGAAKAGTSGKAIASLVLGILCCVPLLGVAAIVLGVLALRDIGRANGALGGRGLAITGLILGALQTLVIVAVGGFLVANPDVFDTIPGEPSEILEVGECVDIDLNQTEVTISRSDVVPCDQPHSAEYAGSPLVSDPPDAEYPGEEALRDEGLELCLDEFERLTGRSLFDEPDLDLFILYPPEFSWDLFDQRTIDCFITSFDGSPLTAPILD